ncbi:Mitogen-activated protein kinase 4a [Phlyctochytrium planicorne]|nr:Mitogen-activated protein kinase 4a [Phlyctochytrium planicorne]
MVREPAKEMLLNKIVSLVAAAVSFSVASNAQAVCDASFVDGFLIPQLDPYPLRAKLVQEVGQYANHSIAYPGLPPILLGLNGAGAAEFERLQFTSVIIPWASAVASKNVQAQIQFEAIKFNVTTLTDYLTLYGSLFPSPNYVANSNDFFSDSFFGRSRHMFYGNYIKNIAPTYTSVALTAFNFIADAALSGVLPAGQTLNSLYLAGKLYVEDHSEFSFLSSYFSGNRYMAFPTALFYRSATGLKPLAIRLTPTLIVTPKDGAIWKLAKIATNSAHSTRTHFALAPLTTSTMRTMASNHPIRTILSHLLRQSQGILGFGMKSLLEPKLGFFDHLYAIGSSGDVAMLQYIYANKYTFFGSSPDNEVKNRGLTGLVGDMPFIDVNKQYYVTFFTLSKDLVNIYYVDDASVVADKELQNFAADVVTNGKVKGFPSTIPTRDALANIIAQVFFTTTIRHAVVGSLELAWTDSLPLSTNSLRKPLPLTKSEVTEANLVSWLPNTRQALDEIGFITRFGRPVQPTESLANVFTAIPTIGLAGVRSAKTACAFEKYGAMLDQIKLTVDNISLNDPIIKGWDAMTPAKVPNYFYN